MNDCYADARIGPCEALRNCALLADAFHSALRTPCSAAKHGRWASHVVVPLYLSRSPFQVGVLG
jgi:hypothetical protein